jgi:hypothetical protein
MAISDTKKVDYLWKKIGYGATKTDTNALKKAPNEAIPSPLLLNGKNTWNRADQIPAVQPGSSSGVVTVYPTSAPIECTQDITATANRTWKTGQTDWIPTEFGSTYQAKVYVHTASDAAGASGGTQLFATGSGNDDEWFFDYQSGVLHFIGTNLPNGVNFTGKSIYIAASRYTGQKGLEAILTEADKGNFTFIGSTINQDVTNTDFTFDTAGLGNFVFDNNTGLVLPSGTTAERPSAVAGMLRYNSQTGKFEGSIDGSTFVTIQTDNGEANVITKDIFVGDASTTDFTTLAFSPADENNIIVYIDGVMQEPDQNYSLSGNTISFSESPHLGARVVIIHGFDSK